MYTIIFYILFIIVVVPLLLLLFAPFRIIVCLKRDDEGFCGYTAIKWLMLSYKPDFKQGSGKTGKKVKKAEIPSFSRIKNIIKLFKSMKKPSERLARDFFHIIQIKKLHCNLTYGFSDPAETGIYYGFLCSVMGFIDEKCNNNCDYRFTINPVFNDNLLKYEVVINIGFRLYSLVPSVVRFVTERKVLKTIWNILRKNNTSH